MLDVLQQREDFPRCRALRSHLFKLFLQFRILRDQRLQFRPLGC